MNPLANAKAAQTQAVRKPSPASEERSLAVVRSQASGAGVRGPALLARVPPGCPGHTGPCSGHVAPSGSGPRL